MGHEQQQSVVPSKQIRPQRAPRGSISEATVRRAYEKQKIV